MLKSFAADYFYSPRRNPVFFFFFSSLMAIFSTFQWGKGVNVLKHKRSFNAPKVFSRGGVPVPRQLFCSLEARFWPIPLGYPPIVIYHFSRSILISFFDFYFLSWIFMRNNEWLLDSITLFFRNNELLIYCQSFVCSRKTWTINEHKIRLINIDLKYYSRSKTTLIRWNSDLLRQFIETVFRFEILYKSTQFECINGPHGENVRGHLARFQLRSS